MFGAKDKILFHDLSFQLTWFASSYHVQEVSSMGEGWVRGYRFVPIYYSIMRSNCSWDPGN